MESGRGEKYRTYSKQNYNLIGNVFQPAIIDGSFEHEIWNTLTRSRLMLFLDFKHPDMGPDDDFLDPRLWDIKEIEGQAIYQIKDAAMSL